MQSAHSLIEHIAGLTSQRDLDLLSFSLLKSLHSMLKPKEISMLRFNAALDPVQEIRFSNNDCQVVVDGIVVQEQLLQAIAYMTSSESDKHDVPLVNDDRLCVYLMNESRRNATYLVIQMNHRISKSEDFLLAGVLEIFKNFGELIRYSQTDELTGLANRKTFESAINKVYELLPLTADYAGDEEKRAAVPDDRGYWLVILDIDHFKRINDEFGHLFGDEVLVKLAQLLSAHFREQDMVFRFGGEEFVIIMRCPDKDACALALERLRTSIANTEFPGVGKVTVSGGAVEVDRGTFHITLLDYADKALYASKDGGRDRITFFEDMVARGEAAYEAIQEGGIELF